MEEFYDIKRLPANGCLVLPLSISKLATSQSPTNVIEHIQHLLKKVQHMSVDICIVYANGLYQYSDEPSHTLRTSLLNKTMRHKYELCNLLMKQVDYPAAGFQFYAWDQVLINLLDYFEALKKLKNLISSDDNFLSCIQVDLSNFGCNEATISFVLEELILVDAIMNRKFIFQHILSMVDPTWQLIAYDSKPLETHKYIYKHQILSQHKPQLENNKMYNKFYDLKNKVLADLEQSELSITC